METLFSRNGDRITHREMPKLTELGELDYRLVIFESVSNPDDTNVPTILTFYLIDRDIGCPKQSLTFVLEVTCPKKKLLFNYGKVEFIKSERSVRRACPFRRRVWWILNRNSTYNAPLQHIEPENYELMGYYQGLNKKFETLNNTKTEPGFKKLFLAQFYLSRSDTVADCFLEHPLHDVWNP